jgi:thiol-disulfide isomerase/thioredoxin
MLLEFYGTECPHCIHMQPLIEQLEKEEGVEITQYETWHNEDNAKKMQEYDKGLCGGVPFFFNTDTGKHICGGADYETLKQWAKGW